MNEYEQAKTAAPIQPIQDCFKLMKLANRNQQLFVPACIQFKIKSFTSANFQNLLAKANGVLCINFFIFTQNKSLSNFLCDRLYFNSKEQKQLEMNRRKKMQRGSVNYLPVMFNKDVNIKLPTTQTKEFQIQSFKSKIRYKKNGLNIEGTRICHIIRKEFRIQIKKNSSFSSFFAPFNFINLELLISLDHMLVSKFQFNQTHDQEHIKRQQLYMEDQQVKSIKRISFNLLRIEQPFRLKLEKQERTEIMGRMIGYYSEEGIDKYAVVQTELEAFTHDQRQLQQGQSQQLYMKQLFQDIEPKQLNFKPFKYAVFKIPMFRYPIVDMMSIFIPLWLLSFVSVYIYFQPTEIVLRIINVAALMIAYAAIQPIVRDNLPEATSLTLVDALLYSQLVVNILFIISSIDTIQFYDNLADKEKNPYPKNLTNPYLNRWDDSYFIASLVISVANVAIVVILIVVYLCRKGGFKAGTFSDSSFQISDKHNWTLTLLMERNFARYKEKLIFIP